MVVNCKIFFVIQSLILIERHFAYLWQGWHQICGSIAFTLAILQPIGAAFRPHPDNPKRPYFNWLHFLGGNVAHIASIAAILFASNLKAAHLSDSFLWTAIGFVIFHVTSHIIMQFHSCLMYNKSECYNCGRCL